MAGDLYVNLSWMGPPSPSNIVEDAWFTSGNERNGRRGEDVTSNARRMINVPNRFLGRETVM